MGDALQTLQQLSSSSVDMVLTSPPYFLLRHYGVSGELGAEAHVDQWVTGLAAVTHELGRVLVPTGTLWLNLGDTYATHSRQGAARKSLLLGPERLALHLVEHGWTLRQKLIWHKPNGMPTSVRDRLASHWEVVYILARQPRYFFDLDSIRLPHTSQPSKRPRATSADVNQAWRGSNAGNARGLARLKATGLVGHPLGKNPGDVWTIATSSFHGGHHATFPVALAERAIQAGSPEARCSRCRAPWRRPLIRAVDGTATRGRLGPTCDCAVPAEPALVLDPFMGAGTTAVAAERLGRDWLGVELNPDYATLAERRITTARATRPQPVAQPPPAA